jgi:DNA (cytosine-5)-methyltransferase 1
MPSVYYNEIDPHCAAWLQALMNADAIPRGDIDTRSIEDVTPNDVRGYTQCHFFAGIGGWAYALDLAGWPRSRPVWTGSCPCQPFSAAGKGAGFEDERHLWPAWQHLIAQCRPAVVFGEQVASKHADAWIDLVHADMEGMGYAFGCVPFPAAGIGSPHIRDRNYWVGVGLADADNAGLEGRQLSAERAAQCIAGARGVAGGVGYAHITASERNAGSILGAQAPQHGARLAIDGGMPVRPEHAGAGMGRLAYASRSGRREECADDGRSAIGDQAQGFAAGLEHGVRDHGSSPTNGFWRTADWIACRDGKWRPVEPGTFPLAHGLPARVVRLRGYGNAIVPAQAAIFIQSYIEARNETVLSLQTDAA